MTFIENHENFRAPAVPKSTSRLARSTPDLGLGFDCSTYGASGGAGGAFGGKLGEGIQDSIAAKVGFFIVGGRRTNIEDDLFLPAVVQKRDAAAIGNTEQTKSEDELTTCQSVDRNGIAFSASMRTSFASDGKNVRTVAR